VKEAKYDVEGKKRDRGETMNIVADGQRSGILINWAQFERF
jgi:hypothetical protein